MLLIFNPYASATESDMRQNATECGEAILGRSFSCSCCSVCADPLGVAAWDFEFIRRAGGVEMFGDLSLAHLFPPCQGPAEQNYRCMHVNHHGNDAGRLPGSDAFPTMDVLGEFISVAELFMSSLGGQKQTRASRL